MIQPDFSELGLEHLGSGKVRECYKLDEERLAFVTTDRLSAFDVVMREEIPNKGRVLNAMTAFWKYQLLDIVSDDETVVEVSDIPEEIKTNPYFWGRTIFVHRAEMFPVECIVRAHLTGSAWKEYQQTGTIHKMPAPSGLREAERLPSHIYTPSTKAERGHHDENITFDESVTLLNDGEVAEQLRELSLEIFGKMYERAAARGIVMADTKFEFGRLATGLIVLCDEVGTADSSRYWPADQVVVGQNPPSFDKQFVRDYLTSLGWDKQPPPPPLPADIVNITAQKYQEGYELITGLDLRDWPGIQT